MAQSTLEGFGQKRKVIGDYSAFLSKWTILYVLIDCSHFSGECNVAQRDGDNSEDADSDYVPNAPAKPEAAASSSMPAAKKPRAKPGAGAKAKAKTNATAVGYCSLTKKDFGDRIKAALALEKYAVQSMCFAVRAVSASSIYNG